MSDKEEKSSNDEGTTGINQDGGTKNLIAISEGIVTLDSLKKKGDFSTIPENKPRSESLEGSGDHGHHHILEENSKSNIIESELKGITKELMFTESGKESGDFINQIKNTELDDKKIEDSNTDIDLNEAKSKCDVIPEQDDSNVGSLNKCDEIKHQKLEDSNEDEDMELRWDDDDDGSNEAVGKDDKINLDSKNEDILSEDQLLEEPSDVITKEISDMNSDENSKGPENSLECDLLKDDSEENYLTEDKTSKEIASKLSSSQDISPEKTGDKNISNISEENLLEETNINAELIKSPEVYLSAEESLDQNDITDILEDKLLEESKIKHQTNIEEPEIEKVKEISVGKDNKPSKEKETIEYNLMNEFPTDDQTKEGLDDVMEEDKLLAESESNTESLIEVKLSKSNDDVISIENILKEADSVIGPEYIPEKDTESSRIISANKDSDDSDDILLEEKLLEDTETVIPGSDVTMEIDDEKEGELLRDDKSQDETCIPMDVDITDPSFANQVKMDDKIDQSGMKIKDTAPPTDHETNIEKVNVDQTTDQIMDMDQLNDQAKITETIIDQPIENIAQTADTNKDTTIAEESQTVVTNKVIAIDNEAAIEKKITTETEKKVVHDVDKNRIEDINNQQSHVESYTTGQSNNSSKLLDTPTVSNTSKDVIEEIVKSTFEERIKNKEELKEPELTTETINPENNLDEVNETDEILDKNLDKTNASDEVSHNNSSMFLQDSPIRIKTDHGLHRPDVMLEIPTQELIDMDDTDFSMNLDQCDVVDSTNDFEEDVEREETFDKMIALDDDVKREETIEKIIALDKDIESEKTIAADVTGGDIKADKIVAEVDTVNEKSVDSKAEETEKAISKIITDDGKSVDQKAIVTEPTVSEVQNDVESAREKKLEDSVIQASGVEENMESMFADPEPDVVTEVPEGVATTSKAEPTAEQPSTSITRMTPDTSDEVPEISDSLGLLAESAGRMMEDDEDDEDVDEDDDFDNDESSNQISAEQSEDSNPAALEAEPARDQEDKDLVTPEPKDEEFPFMSCVDTAQGMVEKMDVEVEEYGTLQLQADSMSQMNEETKSAVDALLRDNAANDQVEDQQGTTDQMDIETVKLSDASDNEIDVEPTEVAQAVAEISKEVEEQQDEQYKSPNKTNVSPKQSPSKLSQSPCMQSPSKMKNLAITAQGASSVLNIVDLEESSSEDEILEVEKRPEPEKIPEGKPPSPDSEVTNVNIPTGIDIMCTSGGNISEIRTKEGEVVISGVPKPPPQKPARLNTSEVSIKTVSTAEPLVIPEAKMNDPTQTPTQPTHKLSLEIFSLDSDDEESAPKEKSPHTSPHKMNALEMDKARETSKCINYCCNSDSKVPYKVAEPAEVAFYDGGRKRRSMVCQPCADVVAQRTLKLMQGIKDMSPLLDLDMGKSSQDLVEISDSESEDEEMTLEEPKESIGEKGAKFIEDNLAKFLNDTWKKYDMDVRLKETQIMLDDEIEKLEQDSKEIDAMLNECQVATDKLRNELYASFECRRQQLPALILYDTPESKFIGPEDQVVPPTPPAESIETRQAKRRLSSTCESPAKRPAIPLGYAPLDAPDSKEKAAVPGPDIKIEDDKDISVVKLSAEAAPADLPPPGEISRPPLRVGLPVYAMKNAFGPWLKGRVLEIQPKNPSGGNPFSLCRVKFDHKTKTNGKVLPARCIAYSEPADVRMTIGTRLIALFKDSNKRESYYSGVVAEIPNPVNNYRYLVFFDDGYAQYVQHQFTRLVCESSPLVWEEVHPFSREFVREYLLAYPERPMVRLHEGQHLKTEWNGKWWSSRVTRVDASLAQVMFVGDGRREWVYRGSTRLAPLYLELRAAERHRVRPMPRSKAQPRFNMPYVEYTRSDEPGANKQEEAQVQQQNQQQNEEIRRQRAVAKKSTSAPPQVFPPSQPAVPNHTDPVTSRVVYYTPKNAVKPLKMVPHRCSPKCKRNDVLSLKELRTYNPLAKPLLSGWERQIIRFKGHKEVMYRAPCGRRLRSMRELHHYLRTVDSDLPVDLFDFHYSTHCLAEFVLNKCLVGKKDLSHGKENVPVPCVNYFDDSLPEFCSYNTERTPTAGVPLNLAPEFLCGCDCTDDCQDKSKCACWKMTLEGARTIGLNGPNVGYVYKRLPEPLPSGIYECNSRCKCKHTCLNRVAQHPLQLKLQVFKTPNRGWGIRALNDVPKGSFLCVYAGNLLTDATANLDGLNEGDEYLAELDYIEVVEQMKEGYEEDIPEADKKLDKKESKEGDDSEEDEPPSSEEEDTASKTDKEDDDFRPGYIGLGVTEFSKRLRKRGKSKKDKEKPTTDEKDKDTSNDTNKDISKDAKDTKDSKELNAEEDCITISDDEEVREPSRFMVQENMKSNEYISKYKSVRTLFGKDEACYIMDAKVQGNIGRYLNHSCCPNVFVQNVFVDTHDPRFPWVAFFALSHIKAGTELTWNYNYDVGSVPGKILYCYCGAANCRGRLL